MGPHYQRVLAVIKEPNPVVTLLYGAIINEYQENDLQRLLGRFQPLYIILGWSFSVSFHKKYENTFLRFVYGDPS